MAIKLTLLTRQMKQPVWMASYVPETQERIWFGWVKKNKKTGKISYQPGVKPDRQSRSGNTKEEALERLHSYLDAAFQAYLVVNHDYRETSWKTAST